MKDYFIRLFNYDHFANQTIIKAIRKANDPVKAVRLMAHLLTAQQIWLVRCQGELTAPTVLWPEGNADFEQMTDNNNRLWLNHLNTLTADDFDKEIVYHNLQGIPYQNKLSDILAHVINHGTHHRAQIGQQLNFAGAESLPITDYIFYIRN
ncbi:MAG TPA: DinB family protein [Mucilaginibacter sp.]|jgi:uncharacterized damage-inducible protein DinB|nr:DinB family protein [Mucilaginibacter sp.]